MNKLPEHKRKQVLNMLVEGSSMRSISRVVGVSMNTVIKLLVDAGEACQAFYDEHVLNIQAQRVQCDELWPSATPKRRTYPQSFPKVLVMYGLG